MLRAFLFLSVLLAAVSAMGLPVDDCKPTYKCPKGYKIFQNRKNGPWCMKVFPGNMTWWEAERECRCTTKGAHLSGIESSAEKRWLEEESQIIFDKSGIKDGAIWIGAYRRKDCPSGNESLWSKNEKCTEEKMFQFTDKFTCGTYIFDCDNWVPNFPTSQSGDNCGVIVVSTETSGANSDASGKTADKNCETDSGSSSLLNSVGYVCGVKPVESGGGGGYGGGGYGEQEIMIIGAGKPEKH